MLKIDFNRLKLTFLLKRIDFNSMFIVKTSNQDAIISNLQVWSTHLNNLLDGGLPHSFSVAQ